MGWATLAKYAAWAALILGVCGIIWYGIWAIHDDGDESGYNRAQKENQLKLIKTQTDEARKRSEISELAARARIQFMRADDVAQNEKETLGGRIIDMHVAGLRYRSDPANQNCGSEENTDSQVNGGTTRRIRLPEKIEGDILGITKDAQLVVIAYNKLRKVVKSIPCVEIVE